jgi:hypothetical protein
MFPAGAVGAALLIVRISVAALLLLLLFTGGCASFCWWELTLVAAIVISLCLGICTPLSSTICVFVEASHLLTLRGGDALHLLVSVLITGSLAILGPGAFSIDAKLFGRRLIALGELPE